MWGTCVLFNYSTTWVSIQKFAILNLHSRSVPMRQYALCMYAEMVDEIVIVGGQLFANCLCGLAWWKMPTKWILRWTRDSLENAERTTTKNELKKHRKNVTESIS